MTSKSNAEVAARIVQGWSLNDANDPHAREALEGRIESALTTAQSQLAKDVLEAMSTMAGGNHGGGLVVVSREAAVERLRDLFTRLGISVE